MKSLFGQHGYTGEIIAVVVAGTLFIIVVGLSIAICIKDRKIAQLEAERVRLTRKIIEIAFLINIKFF